jgi:lipopolysaccharide heptosyltransferase I
VSRILLIRLSSLGDVIFSMAAADRLLEAMPGAEISFLVEDRFADIPRTHPGIREVLVVPRREGRRAVLDFRRTLRERTFDAVVDMQGNAKSAIHVSAIPKTLKIGFAAGASRNLSHLWANRAVAPPAAAKHRVDRFLSLLAPLGIEAKRAKPVAHVVPQASLERAAATLAQAGKLPRIVMHPGTSAFGMFKRWEPERFGRLAKQLSFIPGAATFITGAPGEEELIHDVEEASCGGALALEPASSLSELMALVSQAQVVVAADTGPLHLANRMGTPVVGLFGPKDPELYGPAFQPSVAIRREDVPCSPCTRRWCEAPACMAGITVESAAYAVRRFLR